MSAPGSATGGSAIAAVARSAAAGPAHVAAVLRQHPEQRAPIVAWLQAHCGNGFVQAVLAHRDPAPVEAWAVVATPHSVRFPNTEVGAVSAARTITLTNRGSTPVELTSLDLVPHGGIGEAAQPGEFEIVRGQPRHLEPLESLAVEIVFRPTRVLPHLGARVRAKGDGGRGQLDVVLKATAIAPRAEHADQRELSVAEHDARRLEVVTAPKVEHYGDMLAAVLAARAITDRAKPDDAEAHAKVSKLLEPVAQRLNQLNDHQGRFAKFGAGNIAGQAALDMSEAAVRSWLQLVALGGMVRTEELVTRFRVAAEPIRFLTGERADAPTLQAFDHASRTVAVGAAALALGPALVALAAEEAALLAFASRMAARQVAVWALSNPAAALAASEALLGFGVQIGEDGWEPFWEQLHDPQGCWFVIAQVLMDFMHVRGNLSGHGDAPNRARSVVPDLEGARQRAAQARSTLQQVHDAAASKPGRAGAPATNHEPGTLARSETQGDASGQNTSRAPGVAAETQPSSLRSASASNGAAADHEPQGHPAGRTGPTTPSIDAASHDLTSLLPADLSDVSVQRSPGLRGNDVVVHYRNGAVHIEVGPTATARHVSYHIAAVRQLRRFEGPLGFARRLIDGARSKLKLTPGHGRAGFEGKAEVAKLLEIERDLVALRHRLEDGAHVVERGRVLDPGAVEAELARVQEQLEVEAARIDSYEPGKGFVAARSLPEYPVDLKSVIATESDADRLFEVSFTARTKEGTQIPLGTGHVALTDDGEPAGYPEFTLDNYTHFDGEEHKVKLYPAVISQGADAAPIGKGEEVALTRYAIDHFIQRYKARFGDAPAALGGTLAWENKKNFQVQYIKHFRETMNVETSLAAAAREISYGRHRIAAGYDSLQVDPGPPESWVSIDLHDGNGPIRVPKDITIVARNK